MKTGNNKYLDIKENRKFYDTSDGEFMHPSMAPHASDYLQRLKWAKQWIDTNAIRTILDVGTKDGYFPIELTLEGRDVTAIDPSADAIERARNTARQLGLDINYIVSYFEDYDLDNDEVIAMDGKYEAVVCCEVIEHVVDDEAFLYKLCSAGHYILVSTPDYYGRHGIEDAKRNEAHVRLYTMEELKNLGSKFGEVLEIVNIDDQLCMCIKSRV